MKNRDREGLLAFYEISDLDDKKTSRIISLLLEKADAEFEENLKDKINEKKDN